MIWVLLMTAIFGPLVVPSVMGVIVWIERSKHNSRTRQQFPNTTDWWRQRSSARLSPRSAVALVPRHFKLSDALTCSGIVSLAVGIAGATVMGYLLVVVTWRVFGPGDFDSLDPDLPSRKKNEKKMRKDLTNIKFRISMS